MSEEFKLECFKLAVEYCRQVQPLDYEKVVEIYKQLLSDLNK